eukprot:GHVU01051768.1.p1 GENE.GHVU01051768.1~~GHVU01051768.1.p1  ORF type:complete len:237 (-),score=29.33 GHVU01051768.1:953-1663(-)
MKHRIRAADLHNILDYDTKNGKLWWNTGARKDKLALRGGQGVIYGEMYLARDVMWALVHGAWPKGTLECIDGNPRNCALENIRIYKPSRKSAPSPKKIPPVFKPRRRWAAPQTVTDLKGISWDSRARRWRVQINRDGKRVHVGYYEDLLDAQEAHGRTNATVEVSWDDEERMWLSKLMYNGVVVEEINFVDRKDADNMESLLLIRSRRLRLAVEYAKHHRPPEGHASIMEIVTRDV